jgi:hypothetical protein
VLPPDWIFGTDRYLSVFQANKRYKRITEYPAVGATETTLSDLISTGESLSKLFQNLALDDQNRLRTKDAFEPVIKQYKDQVSKILDDIDSNLKREQQNGPPPLNMWAEPLPKDPVTGNLAASNLNPSLKKNVALCPGVKPSVTYKKGSLKEPNNGAEGHLLFWPEKEVKLKLNEKFAEVLPKSILWAERMNDSNRPEIKNIEVCVRKAELTDYEILAQRPGQRPGWPTAEVFLTKQADVNLVLEVNLTYIDDRGRRVGPVKVKTLSGTYSFSARAFNPGIDYSFWHSLWTGTRVSKDMVQFYPVPGEPGKFGVENYPKFFAPLDDKDADANLAAFEGDQRGKFKKAVERALGPIEGKKSPQKKNLDLPIWQLVFLMEHGTNLGTPEARDLLSWLQSGGLPRLSQIVELVSTDNSGDWSKDKTQNFVDQLVAQLEEKLSEIESAGGLKPAPDVFAPRVNQLQAIRGM